MKKSVTLFALLFLFCSFLQNSNSKPFVIADNKQISLIFAGDVMGHMPQVDAAFNPANGTYNYDACFRYIKPYLKKADIAIANLEVPIAGRPYSGYPRFSSPDALLDALKNAGFTMLLTANNHVLDRQQEGLERTITQINKRGLFFAGSYLTESQRDSLYPVIINAKGLKIAILNCSYGTNDNEVQSPNYVNYIDTLEIKDDIRKAEREGADIKIMTVHWGIEYELHANETQRKLAQFFVNHGINLIVGSHPHVVQNEETLYDHENKAVPVFYSLGNLISNQRKPDTDGGIMLKVDIDVQTKTIIKQTVMPVWVYRGVLNNEYQYHLIPTAEFIIKPERFKISKSDSLSLRYFDSETRKRLAGVDIFR